MKKLTADHFNEMRLLIVHPKNGSSYRYRDGLRKTLKRLGMIHFDRTSWQWEVLPAGRDALRKEEQMNG